jgi:hypothetical protein
LPLVIKLAGKRRFNDLFLPVLTEILKNGSNESKLALIENFYHIFEVIGPQTLNDLVEPTLTEFAHSGHKEWRRKVVFLQYVTKAAQFGNKEGLSAPIIKLFHELMLDSFESVRDQIASSIVSLKEYVGEEWVRENIMVELEK